MTTPQKKLIEVALPLPEINDASAYDKMPGIGPHPKGIHQWWARLPLPTARAILFASLVDDPSTHPERWPTQEVQDAERHRLFGIIKALMGKKLHEHPEVYAAARAEIARANGGHLPAVFDPFAGGGSIPLEASRLGLPVHAGDINPIAVLLNKCNLEIAPRWAKHPPVNPQAQRNLARSGSYRGTVGLADDVRFYGRLIDERAREKIGHLFPRVMLPKKNGGGEADVVALIWARTVATPNPGFAGCSVPLMGSFVLSTAKGNEAHIEPLVNGKRVELRVKHGVLPDSSLAKHGTAFVNPAGKKVKATFRCLLSGDPLKGSYIDEVANTSGLGYQLAAVVAEGGRRRVYLDAEQWPAKQVCRDTQLLLSEAVSANALPKEPCRGTFASNAQGRRYGFATFSDYFTPRQLVAAWTLLGLVREVSREVERDAVAAGMAATEAPDYARAVTTFLGLALDRTLDFNNSLARWSPSNQKVMNLFSKHAIPMVWDFAEANTLGNSVGAWVTCSDYVADCVAVLGVGTEEPGVAEQIDIGAPLSVGSGFVVSTDPPYYDNISYSSLSDFFYVWLRRAVGESYPALTSTMLTPKHAELTASPEKFDANKEMAKSHFESGFLRAFSSLREVMDPRFPLTVYYAFKQDDEDVPTDESDVGGVDRTTGWETLLEALLASGFEVTGTWPVRASQKWRQVSMGANALASYIVLACRLRPTDAPQSDRRTFLSDLKRELPDALRRLQQGNIAPVDFAQAAIGPGISVFSRASRVLESNGARMSVRTALAIINQTLTEVLSESEDAYDADTQWAVAWFDAHGFDKGPYGEAELLSKAKNTAVGGLKQGGLIASKDGMVRLLRPTELASNWDPETDRRFTVWEATHHLLRVYFHEKAGDMAAGQLLGRLGAHGEEARDLAYRLFNLCERRRRAQEALGYNALVLGWPELARIARQQKTDARQQADLFSKSGA